MLRSSIVAMSVVAALSSGLFADEFKGVMGYIGKGSNDSTEAGVAVGYDMYSTHISFKKTDDIDIYKATLYRVLNIHDKHFIGSGLGVVHSEVPKTGNYEHEKTRERTTKVMIDIAYENNYFMAKSYLADAHNHGTSIEVPIYKQALHPFMLTAVASFDEIQGQEQKTISARLHYAFGM